MGHYRAYDRHDWWMRHGVPICIDLVALALAIIAIILAT